MPRLAIFNMTMGFACIALAASAGAFVATEWTEIYLEGQNLNSWGHTLRQSAHGHLNMFGMLHILFGLTLSYSVFGSRTKLLQSLGLGLGSFAMGPLMLLRSFGSTSNEFDINTTLTGLFLSAALLAIFFHVAGLAAKAWR